MVFSRASQRILLAVVAVGVFAFLPRPTSAASILSVSPDVVDPRGGTTVVVTGAGFGSTLDAQRLFFGGARIPSDNIIGWSDAKITLVSPALRTSRTPLQVRFVDPQTGDDTRDGWIYLQPVVTNLVTSSRAYPDLAAVGSTVTITGRNFTEDMGAVWIDGQEAEVTSWASTRIVAIVPEDATDGRVTVGVFDRNTGDESVKTAAATKLWLLPTVTDDTFTNENQWWLTAIGGPDGWDLRDGAEPVTVAVIDDGVDIDHYDLTRNIWTNRGDTPGNGRDDDGNGFVDDVHGWNFVADDNSDRTYGPHGTARAGIIAATGDNNAGVAGLDWTAKIMPLTVVGGRSNSSAMYARALRYAVDNGAGVILLNIDERTAVSSGRTLLEAVTYAYDKGAVIVAGVGDPSFTGVRQPRNLNLSPLAPVCTDGRRNVILGVAAVDRDDQKAPFSDYGSRCVDVSAPGTNIFTTLRVADDRDQPKLYDPARSGYGLISGTGAAAAIVAGVAAAVRAVNPEANNVQVMDIIKRSADPLNDINPRYAGQLGRGRVNLAQALEIEPDLRLRPGWVLGAITARPKITAVRTADGAAVITVKGKKLALRPLGRGYRGDLYARRVDFGFGKVLYIIAPTSQNATDAVYVYDARGRRRSVVRPFTVVSQQGINPAMVIQTFNDRVYLAVAQEQGTGLVQVYQVTSGGLKSVQTLTLSRSRLRQGVAVAFLPVYKREFALVTAVDGRPTTVRVWKYSLTDRQFVLDKTVSRSRFTVGSATVVLR